MMYRLATMHSVTDKHMTASRQQLIYAVLSAKEQSRLTSSSFCSLIFDSTTATSSGGPSMTILF